jgi:hypothetical protein
VVILLNIDDGQCPKHGVTGPDMMVEGKIPATAENRNSQMDLGATECKGTNWIQMA